MAGGEKRPVGRPTLYDADFHPADFVEQSKRGKNLTQIACGWNANRDTLYTWGRTHTEFNDALKQGREYCEAWYTNLGMAAMTGQTPVGADGKKMVVNLGFYVWMTKNILKWKDQVESEAKVESTGTVNVNWNTAPQAKKPEEHYD